LSQRARDAQGIEDCVAAESRPLDAEVSRPYGDEHGTTDTQGATELATPKD